MILRFIKNRPVLSGAVLAFLAAGYISAFWCQFLLLHGDSMEPTYHGGQLLILDKHTGEYSYGDVVAIKKAGVGCIVKRVVALPGDTVQIREGVLYVNGEPGAWREESIDDPGIAADPLLLEPDRFFVLGDNYSASRDSRHEEIGLIGRTEIVGRVFGSKRER